MTTVNTRITQENEATPANEVARAAKENRAPSPRKSGFFDTKPPLWRHERDVHASTHPAKLDAVEAAYIQQTSSTALT